MDLRMIHRARCDREVVDKGRLIRLTAVAAIGASIVNAVVYFIAKAVGAISPDVRPMGSSSLNVAQVVLATIIGVVLASIALLIIGRFRPYPYAFYQRTAVTAFVVSLLTPASLSGITVAMAIALMSMHLVAFAFSYVVLPNALRRPETND